MDVKSTAKTVRYTPRKVRLVLDLVRAAANATHNHQLNAEALYVKECYANEGVVMKRFMPRAKGNAAQILKRTSHITVVVSDVK